jgi:hypothetical protein
MSDKVKKILRWFDAQCSYAQQEACENGEREQWEQLRNIRAKIGELLTEAQKDD